MGKASHDWLSGLPDGLLTLIFEAVGRISRRDLCSVSRLNKRIHALADSILYRTVLFNSHDHHIVFRESLNRRPRRGSAIQDITVKLNETSLELSQLLLEGAEHVGAAAALSPTSPLAPALPEVDGLSHAIATMSNLETLDIAVPAKLLHGIGTLLNGPFDLACLRSCTLFYQCPGDQYWDLRENIHMFAHPTLEHLVIRRAKLDYRGFDLMAQPHETGLRTLHLLECDINDDALSDILEFPAGLREFVMTQLDEPTPPLEESSDSMFDYMLALQSAAHSLERITVDFPTLAGRKALRMRDFTALKTLRLNWDYQLFGKSSKKPRLHSVGMPPQLETLEFFNAIGTDDEVTDLLENMISSRSVVAEKLQRVIVTQGDESEVPKVIVDACKEQGLPLDIIGAMEDGDAYPESPGKLGDTKADIDFY